MFTCRIPGIYWFSATLVSSVYGSCYIKLNGATQGYIFVSSYDGEYESGTGSEVFRLKQGDRVQIGGCDTSINLNGGDTINTFSGLLVKAEV